MLTFDFAEPADRSVPIDTGHGTFQILLRPPTFSDEMAGLFDDDPAARRVRAAVVGWSGIHNAAGAEVPFSLPALAAVCRRYPSVSGQIASAVMAMYGPPTEDHRGN